MKWIIIGLLYVGNVWAESSKIIPVFLEAVELYISDSKVADQRYYLRPDILAALEVLEDSGIDPSVFESRINFTKTNWLLRADDKFDQWLKSSSSPKVSAPEMAVHASKISVKKQSDFWFRDDIYAYFFVTDGVIPTGKVTSIYKGIGSGQSFFFNEVDRAIFPLIGLPAKSPNGHLIIDYGIVESDGDDIKELQKLSSIIIDIAIAVYTSYDPQNAQILINLRKEIKALAELLLSLNHDDRLVTASMGYKASELAEMLRNDSYVEVTKRHHSKAEFNSFDYELTFRFLRN